MKKFISKIIDGFRKLINHPCVYVSCGILLVVLFYKNFISQVSDIFKGVFLGVFASLFSYMFTKMHELNVRRYNCMVYLEQELNICFNDLSDNLFQINKILESPYPTVFFRHQLKLTEDYIKDLGRTELREDIYMFYLGLRKIDHDLQGAVMIYERNMDNFKKQSFPSIEEGQKAFESFYTFYKDGLTKLQKAIMSADSELKECLSKIRFFLRTDRPNFYKYLLPYYSKQDYIKWIPEDIERIKAEIEKSKKVLVKE